MTDSLHDALSPGCTFRAQNGDLFAYEEIVRVYQGRICARVGSHWPPGGDADEVIQLSAKTLAERQFKKNPLGNHSVYSLSLLIKSPPVLPVQLFKK